MTSSLPAGTSPAPPAGSLPEAPAEDPASTPEEENRAPAPSCPESTDPIGELIGSQETVAAAPGESALAVAKSLLGTRYAFGGDSPDGFDCSGLVRYAFLQAGVKMPRTSGAMFRQTRRVGIDHLAPGDLVFFQTSIQRVSHVGIYAGEDLFIHSPSRGKEVAYSSLKDPYWRRRLVGAGRVISADQRPAASVLIAAPEG